MAAARERGISTCGSSTTTGSGCQTSEGTTRRDAGRGAGAPSASTDVDVDGLDQATGDALPEALRRTTAYLTHEVFATHHSETAMLRYLRRLSDRDYALDRGMIPLGSCTMKLNATTEMEPVSLPGFADLHPFAPAEDALGYRRLVDQLEGWLARSPATTGSRSSPTPARRASSPACWRSAATTGPGARGSARSA